MNTDNITNGHGITQEMNTIADRKAEETKKEFKMAEKEQGYKPPKFENEKNNKKDESSEGNKYSVKINKGQGYVKDFDSWVNDKIKETEKDNKQLTF